MIKLTLILAIVASGSGRSVAAESMGDPTDLVLRNGAIYTVDAARSWAQAVAIQAGRIAFVGSDDMVERWIGPETRVIDLKGRMVLPGLQDAHIHPVTSGVEAISCDLVGGVTVQDYLNLIRRCAEQQPDEPWIYGSGWKPPAFGPGVRTSRKLLDAIVPDRPVFLYSADAHTAWVNSKALEVANITSQTPDPDDGRIDRDEETGEPVGSLQEGAMELVKAHIPPASLEKRKDGLRKAMHMLNGLGITAVQEADATLAELEAYAALDAAGELNLRVVAAQEWDVAAGTGQIARLLERRGRFTRGRVNAGSAKIFVDGAMENFTALVLEPYLVEGSPSGTPMIDLGQLGQAVAALDAEGFQVHMHAVGDGAVRLALDAAQAAREQNGFTGARHHIAHVQLIHPDDVPRFAELGVAANFQPLWALVDGYMADLTLPFISAERANWFYPIRSVLERGGVVAFGSDWSVSSANPFWGVETAVRRSDPEFSDKPVLLPEQRIPLPDAIAAYTINAAWVNGLDGDTGSIEVGKAADLAVLDQNLFAIEPGQISETKVLLTLLEGEVVFGDPAQL